MFKQRRWLSLNVTLICIIIPMLIADTDKHLMHPAVPILTMNNKEKVLCYNNLIVNCRNGIRVGNGENQIPWPDTNHFPLRIQLHLCRFRIEFEPVF